MYFRNYALSMVSIFMIKSKHYKFFNNLTSQNKVPTHIVVMSGQELKKSTTVSFFFKQLKEEQRPIVVRNDWLVDCILQGRPIDAKKEKDVSGLSYLVDMSKFVIN